MATNKNIIIEKTILPLFLLIILFVPFFVGAQPKEIVPNCSPNCGYYDLLQLVNNIIDWIIWIAVPVAAGVFAWAGILYMTTGIADKKAAAKAMLWKVFWGLVFILSAWIIVTTITNTFLKEEFKGAVPVEGVK